MRGKKEVLHAVKHFLIGSALTIKGFDKVSHHPFIGSIILFFGLTILVYFIYVLFKKHPREKLELLIHWFEALASLFTAYIFFTEGARYLPYVFLLAAAGFFISIYIHTRKQGRAH